MWGPLAWHFLHCITLTAPEKIKTDAYFILFDSLKDTLPCTVCRDHYKRHLQKLQLKKSCSNRKQLSLWLFNLHNMVNKSLDKPIIPADKCIKLYIQNNRIKFNHKMGFHFLDLLAKSVKKVRDPTAYINFFNTLDQVFPCRECREEYVELKVGLERVKSGRDLYEWYNFIKKEWQHDHLYKGCQQLIQCGIDNSKKSMVYNININSGKQFLIKVDAPMIKKLIRLEHMPKRGVDDLYGYFILQNGKRCRRKLLSDLDKDVKLVNPKLTDIVTVDQRRRKAEVLEQKIDFSYLSEQFI